MAMGRYQRTRNDLLVKDSYDGNIGSPVPFGGSEGNEAGCSATGGANTGSFGLLSFLLFLAARPMRRKNG